MKKSVKYATMPEYNIDERFYVSLVHPEDIETAINVYATGYYKGHPLLKSMKCSLEECKMIFREKIIKAVS